jgi:hypothetical protein
VIAAKQATSVIPIVFAAASDPVGTGLVASLARPDGNVTGLSLHFTELGAPGLRVQGSGVGWRIVQDVSLVACCRLRSIPAQVRLKSGLFSASLAMKKSASALTFAGRAPPKRIPK